MMMLAALLLNAVPTPAPGAPVPGTAHEPGLVAFYVAPNGNDTWSGRLPEPNSSRSDGPFATITRARDAIRELKTAPGGLNQPVTVLLRGGTYAVSKPIVFTPEDSGTSQSLITYAAYHGEPVVISGGRRISGWKRVTVEGKALWAASIPEVREGHWYFRQLWVNGQRRWRARHPSKGYLSVAGVPDAGAPAEWTHGETSFEFHPSDLDGRSATGDAEVVVMNRWTDSHLPIAGVDEAQHRVTFTKRSVFRLDPGDLYYVEGAFEYLGAPGEWYLDRKAGVLYYRPMPGEDVRKTEVVAPILSQLVRFEGKPEAGQFVEHLEFRGLTFSHTEWWFPARAPATSSEPEVGGFAQASVGVPGAIYGEGTRDCSFESCAITHVGDYGVELARGCRRNRIVNCEISDLGAGGIKIGETVIRENEAEQTHGNVVSRCRIHDGGRIFRSAVGLWIGQSYDNHIANNQIHDFYYTGLSIGWTWGYGKTLARGNIVESNQVRHIGVRSDGDGPILSDMGGIYTLGIQPGTVVRHNLFHDIAGFRYGGWGIYFDEGSSDIVAEDNIVYRTTHGGFHQHYGRENLVRNNIIAFGRDAQIQRTRPEPHQSFTFERNIVYWREGKLLAGDLSGFQFAFDHNLYWRVGDGEIQFGNLTWQEWREKGMDQHSLIADPLFAAPEKGDFRLMPGSPASQVGFIPIEPVGSASPEGEREERIK